MPGFDFPGLEDEIEHKSLPLERLEIKVLRDEDSEGTFEGYGSIFDVKDGYRDVIKKGAFRETLREWERKGKFPPMLTQHGGWMITDQDGIPVGKWLEMKEDSVGLRVKGKLINLDTDKGRGLYGALKEGVLDGMSIGYVAKEYEVGTKPEEPRRTIKKVDLWELSLVTFPANPLAQVSDVKSFFSSARVRDLEGLLGDRGLSRKDRNIAISAFKDWLRRDAGAPSPDDPRDEATPEEKQAIEYLRKSTDERLLQAIAISLADTKRTLTAS